MGIFIVGSAVILVIFQATLLLLDREQTSWTFSLIQKCNDLEYSKQSAIPNCLHPNSIASSHTKNDTESHVNSYCFLWYPHTSKEILLKPILTQWNPHLILLAIACVHCIIALYATKKKRKEHSKTENHKHYNYMCISGIKCFQSYLKILFITSYVL